MLPIDAFMLTCTGKEQGCTLTLAENRSVKPWRIHEMVCGKRNKRQPARAIEIEWLAMLWLHPRLCVQARTAQRLDRLEQHPEMFHASWASSGFVLWECSRRSFRPWSAHCAETLKTFLEKKISVARRETSGFPSGARHWFGSVQQSIKNGAPYLYIGNNFPSVLVNNAGLPEFDAKESRMRFGSARNC